MLLELCFFLFLFISLFFVLTNSKINYFLFFFLSFILLFLFLFFLESDLRAISQFSIFDISIFITILSTFFVFFLLTLTKSNKLIKNSVFHLFVLFFVSINIIYSSSIVVIFFFFELLLLVSINLLRITSKSERVLEAVNEMYFWTLFGSLFLILGVFLFCRYNNHILSDNSEYSSFIGIFFIIGFGVKIPLWPFTSWLLKAHVEASTEFSILLSGFIIKIGILSLIKILEILNSGLAMTLLFYLASLGIIDACVKLMFQQDLKKIVALTTIIEVNWLIICYTIGGAPLLFLCNYLIIVHSFTTILEFLLVEAISKRYASRDINFINGIWFYAPLLWYTSLFIILITVGFPGTSIFFAKLVFFNNILQFSVFFFIIFIFLFFLYIPIFFFRLWLPLWFGLVKTRFIFDMSKKEFLIFFIFIAINFLLGIFPYVLL